MSTKNEIYNSLLQKYNEVKVHDVFMLCMEYYKLETNQELSLNKQKELFELVNKEDFDKNNLVEILDVIAVSVQVYNDQKS